MTLQESIADVVAATGFSGVVRVCRRDEALCETFWPALFAGRIVPAPLVAEMVRPHRDVPSEARRYGLGFWIRADRDTVMLEGYDAGVSFQSAYDPSSELLYTVMSNTSAGAWPVVKLLDALLPELVGQ